jgi:hypothetical protein
VAVGEERDQDLAERDLGADDGQPDGGPEVVPEAARLALDGWLAGRRGLDLGVRGGLLRAVGALDRDTRRAGGAFSPRAAYPRSDRSSCNCLGHSCVSRLTIDRRMTDRRQRRRDGTHMNRWWLEFTGFLARRRQDQVVARRLRMYVGTSTGR